MIVALAYVALTFQTAPAPAWTWTLYADDDPVVLAHEAPDTVNLRSVLECDRRSGVARMTLYGQDAASGMARISAGDASALAQVEAGRAGAVKLALPVDHPAFAAFAAEGRLSVTLSGGAHDIEMARADLPKLRRFSELCSA